MPPPAAPGAVQCLALARPGSLVCCPLTRCPPAPAGLPRDEQEPPGADGGRPCTSWGNAGPEGRAGRWVAMLMLRAGRSRISVRGWDSAPQGGCIHRIQAGAFTNHGNALDALLIFAGECKRGGLKEGWRAVRRARAGEVAHSNSGGTRKKVGGTPKKPYESMTYVQAVPLVPFVPPNSRTPSD